MKTTVAITTVERIPSPRDKTIACRLCGHEVARWLPKPGGGRTSGMWLMLAHQMDCHREDGE